MRLCTWQLMLILLIVGCKAPGPKKQFQVQRAFYYWQTTYDSGLPHDSVFKSLDVNKLYVRFFDVDLKDYQPFPVAPISHRTADDVLVNDVEIIPVVFIANRTFRSIDSSQVGTLARRIYNKIFLVLNDVAYYRFWNKEYSWDVDPYRLSSSDFMEMHRLDSIRNSLQNRVLEIQIDCDWTKETREKYFMFLTEMKKLCGDRTLSATIRLYPFKYSENEGVPPVDKGMLMCYNSGNVTDVNESNSIFQKKTVMQYLNRSSPYPLLLDYALPIFQWAAIYRNDKILALIQLDNISFHNRSLYQMEELKEENPAVRYTVIASHSIGSGKDSIYLQAGDQIRIECPDPKKVAEVAAHLGKINSNPKPIISIFHYTFKSATENASSISEIFDSF